MNVAAVQRQLRQIALPEVGPAGQERIAQAVVAVAARGRDGSDGDRLAETAARYLAAAGVGTLRLIGDAAGAPDAGVPTAMRQSNPDLAVEERAWPGDGAAWVEALDGVSLVVRSGFDDDAMLRAAIRRGTPVVVARATDDRAELVAFRKHGPCPHAALDIPPRAAAASSDGPGAVVAGTLAAAEALLVLVAGGEPRPGGRARHLAMPLDGGEARAQELPWSPECFACGGRATEMALA